VKKQNAASGGSPTNTHIKSGCPKSRLLFFFGGIGGGGKAHRTKFASMAKNEAMECTVRKKSANNS
jgi:hypothetical protein